MPDGIDILNAEQQNPSTEMTIARHMLAAANASMVPICLYVSVGSSDGLAFFVGVCLFGWVATAMWLRSRWAVLPACILVLIFAVAGFMFSLAVLWPAGQVATLMVGCAGFIVLELASITVALRSVREAQGTQIAGA